VRVRDLLMQLPRVQLLLLLLGRPLLPPHLRSRRVNTQHVGKLLSESKTEDSSVE
jgi:hypothetical protein